MKYTNADKYFSFLELAKKAEDAIDLLPLLADEEKILNFIAITNARGERLSVTDILGRRDLAPSMTMQRKLKALIQKGWIFQEPTEDGRRFQLQLTDNTLDHFKKLSKAMKKAAKTT
jgi:DNA-binding MarR family transcriptional regulator